jgi:glycerol-3-phosphate acyltransferase PlsX
VPPFTIALDAMGGDHAPLAEIEGGVAAARDYAARVLLVGQPGVVALELARHDTAGLPLEIVPAADVIAMDDSPVKALRRKPNASIAVAVGLLRDARTQAVVSAGNTGATLAAAKMELGVLPGVDRPALATVFPTRKAGVPAVLLDVGANVDCTPEQLQQFAVMGEVYYRVVFGVARPRVGLLSIGEEAHKGNEVVRETHRRLKETPLNFEFVGNVEGPDVYSGDVHVVVCDGFIGNIALKIGEGTAEAILTMLKESLSSNLAAQIGYVLAREAFEELRQRIDYSEYGGAPLLGVKGVCVVCHGRSNANAIKNAIRVAVNFLDRGLNDKLEHELALAAAK